MFFLRRPTPQRIDRFWQIATSDDYSYPEVGRTFTGELPAGYNVDRYRVKLGHGDVCFRSACAALAAWKMFQLGWVELLHASGPPAPGMTVVVLAHTLGLYSLSASRVIATIDTDDATTRRWGFSYGTLAHHVERGEERFLIEHDRRDDSVWYDILAFSVPQHPLARLGYHYSRSAQRRFGRDSKAAMQRAVAEQCS